MRVATTRLPSPLLLLGALVLLVNVAVGARLSRGASACTLPSSDAAVVLCSSRSKKKRGALHTLERNDTEVGSMHPAHTHAKITSPPMRSRRARAPTHSQPSNVDVFSPG